MKKFLSLLGFLLIFGPVSQVPAALIENSLMDEGWDSAGTAALVSSSTNVWGNTVITNAYYGDYYAELTGTSSISFDGFWSAGETITFQWAFSAFDEKADSAYFQAEGKTVELAQAGDVSTYIDSTTGLVNVVVGDTFGWVVGTYTFDNDYNGELIFGISNFLADDGHDSKFMVDMGMTSVPEPTSLFLFGSGLLAIASVRRKRQSKTNE